jgi:fructose-1,6-bisphosphatase I
LKIRKKMTNKIKIAPIVPIMSTQEIFAALKCACSEISMLIRESNSMGMSKQISRQNMAGDSVKKLDVIANDIIKGVLMECESVWLIGSEEEDQLVPTKFSDGEYLVCYDPLDGSSNISVNITLHPKCQIVFPNPPSNS